MTTVKPMSFLMNCGDVMCAKKTKITDQRDDDQDAIEAILAHVARYRLSTFAVMSRDKVAVVGNIAFRRSVLVSDARRCEALRARRISIGAIV